MEFKGVKTEKTNFSKSIMSTIVLLYFIGSILGGTMVIVAAINDMRLSQTIDSAMFIAFATYIGGPTATAIGFYAWKSKAENVLKISKSLESDQITEVVTAITTMEGN